MGFRIHWPTQYNVISQEFGARPEFYQKFGLPGHEGLDFKAPMGSEVYAVAAGFVKEIHLDGNSDPVHKAYGNQIRIQHEDGYLSIYAHLSKSLVTQGQNMQTGQLIALADNTGNSYGAHLHLTLKKKGATQAGETSFPHDIIDPTPYLQPYGSEPAIPPQPPATPFMDVEVHSPEVGYLNVRCAPYTASDQIARVNDGDILGALEEKAVTCDKVGRTGQWLWVRLPTGEVGYVAAWYLRLPGDTPPPAPATVVFVVVTSPDEPLKLRLGPGTQFDKLAELPDGSILKALEPETVVKDKLGRYGQWLQVQTPKGLAGHTAAWYLKLQSTTVPLPPKGSGPARYVQVESPEYGLRVREGPGTTWEEVWWVPHGTVLESLETPEITGEKIGQQECWLKVRTPSGHEGFVAAWYVRPPVEAGTLTCGVALAAPAPDERTLLRPDALQRIWGIGPQTEALLHAAGIHIFEQLAAMTEAQIRALLGEAGIRVRYVASWPEQARLAARGEWEALTALQSQLRGRHPR